MLTSYTVNYNRETNILLVYRYNFCNNAYYFYVYIL
jgi:hypothetical protein